MNWLEIKYVSILGSYLDKFKQLKNGLWNFRCPVCGDSSTDAKKTRGYIFQDTDNNCLRFKCHKCGDTRRFSKFLEYVNPQLYKEYKLEYIKEMGFNKPKKTPTRFKRNALKSKSNTNIPLLSKLTSVIDLEPSHRVIKYITSRQIPKESWKALYYSEKMKNVADMIGGYDDTYFDSTARLLLPFIDKNNNLTHIQGRSLDITSKSRYYTLECKEGSPKVFGLNRVNFKKQVYVTEGPIDSLFIKNACAMGGSDIPYDLFDPQKTTFIFDNEPRAKIIVNKMKKTLDKGFSVCVWGNNIKYKDINDIIKSGKSCEWIKDYIANHSYSGMIGKLKIAKYSVHK